MKTKREIKSWLLENCVDKYGDLNLTGLDFRDFDGNVLISGMKVKGNLLQCNQEVLGILCQYGQEVKGDFFDHKLEKNEKWEIYDQHVQRVKKLKPITNEELAEMGYELKGENNE